MRPNLNALRVFVVVARCGTFTLAASHLNVTQGAISQQIAKLEDYVGVKLFNRAGRKLTLTAAGQRLFRGVEEAVDRVEAEIDAARVTTNVSELRISTFSSFAAKWLVPRVNSFHRKHPNIRIQCETTTRLVDFETEGIDLGIRFGKGDWPGLEIEHLLTHKVIAVAHPGFVERVDLTNGPKALIGLQLFYDLDSPVDWSRWFAEAGVGYVEPNLARGFSDSLVMLSALLADDAGVGLMGEHLVEQEVSGGQLVKVFDVELDAEGDFYLVWPKGRSLSREAEAFRSFVTTVGS